MYGATEMLSTEDRYCS